MAEKTTRSVAVVGVGAVLPDAPKATTFWENLKAGRYSITETPPERWDPELYYDADPQAPDKTYSKIGAWVREYEWSPLDWRLPVPPRVSDAMDRGQKWSIGACREALVDYGYPERPLDNDRTAVILGNAMGGDLHYRTALPIYFPEYAEELRRLSSFEVLSESDRDTVIEDLRDALHRRFPGTTEDTMPGELGNIIAGRVANLFNFHGPNYIIDAACASALAALDAAAGGLEEGAYDAVLTGGVDANMSASTYVKFCKIGALSATGTRPYFDGADGFVMGEGAAVFLLKRLADAEAAGDHIYAVVRGIGGASDGKGKGITAPNPVGQRFAVARGWEHAGRAPDSATYIEGHGTSTKVGDVVEVESMSHVFGELGLKPGSMPLGSVKSNIGHLKSGGGRGRHAQGGLRARPEGDPAQPRWEYPESQRRLLLLAPVHQRRAPRVEDRAGPSALRGGERVRLRRHQLPRGDGGVRPGPDRAAARGKVGVVLHAGFRARRRGRRRRGRLACGTGVEASTVAAAPS